jgi:hypothetical protein
MRDQATAAAQATPAFWTKNGVTQLPAALMTMIKT